MYKDLRTDRDVRQLADNDQFGFKCGHLRTLQLFRITDYGHGISAPRECVRQDPPHEPVVESEVSRLSVVNGTQSSERHMLIGDLEKPRNRSPALSGASGSNQGFFGPDDLTLNPRKTQAILFSKRDRREIE